MIFEYPVNFNDIENSFNSYIQKNPNEKSAIIRYYKIWRKAVIPYTTSSGEIQISDVEEIHKNLFSKQIHSNKTPKSHLMEPTTWTFLGPKETFWKNETSLNSTNFDSEGNPKQCPWQANVYAFDVAASNSSILFCGTETGYVNKTSDQGNTWEMVGKNYPFGGGITAVAIHPNHPEIVYVSGGKQLHKTSNGGATWSPLLTGTKFGASRLKISPANPNILAAAAAEGLFISLNNGETWTKKWSAQVWDVEFKPGNDSIIYALSQSSTGFFSLVISSNQGNSFQTNNNFPTFYKNESGGLLATTPANPEIIYATLLSEQNDDGVPFILKGNWNQNNLNWTLKKKGELQSVGGLSGFTNGQGYFDLVLEVSPNDENTVFWGTCTLWKSTDGASSFSKIGGYGGDFPIHPDIQDIKILADGKTWVATDGGMNFSEDQFSSLANYSSRTKGIVGSDMWGFDQGWNEDIVVGGRYHNGNTALADFYGNKALRMGGAESPTGWVIKGKSRHVAFNDLGNGWILPKTAEELPEGRFIFNKCPNIDEYGGRRSNMVQQPNYYGTIFIGEGNGFWKSTDFGQSFELFYQFPDKVRYFEISHKNPNVIYADISGKGLYKSEDGGLSWTQKPSLTGGTYANSSWNGKLFIAISPFDENRIYVCFSNGTWSSETGQIFKSEDGGDTWTNFTNGTNEITKCLVIQPTKNGEDLVYLFTSNKNGETAKVFYRYQEQPYWTNFDENYPAGMDVNIALTFYRDAKIRVPGNAGIWESKMADTTFIPVLNPWVEKKEYDCLSDTLYFDDHSILNHLNASWEWEISPEPEYISDKFSRNPKVVLGSANTFDVTLKVTQNDSTFSKTISEMVSAQTCPSVNNCSNPAYLDQSSWSLRSTDSEEITGEDGRAINAFDGNPETFWHTEWYYSKPQQPHEIQIDLGKEYLLSYFEYLPRQNSSNGQVKDFEVYVSTGTNNWGYPILSGSFEAGTNPAKFNFEPVFGRYIKFKTLSEQNGNPFSTVAEIYLKGCIQQNNTFVSEMEKEKLTAYPIPANNYLHLSLPGNTESKMWNFSVYSANGICVETDQFEAEKSEFTLNTTTYNSGIYFLSLINSKGINYKVKFVVKK